MIHEDRNTSAALGPKKLTKGEVRCNVTSLSSRGIVFWFVSNLFRQATRKWSPSKCCCGQTKHQREVVIFVPTKSFTLATTMSCCSDDNCGNMGKEIIPAAIRSVTGKSPFL